MNTAQWYKSFTRVAASAALTVGMIFGGAAVSQTGKANPYNLIDPNQISVGTMGDSRPYAFVDKNGEFSGFDIELFLDVARRDRIQQGSGHLHRDRTSRRSFRP